MVAAPPTPRFHGLANPSLMLGVIVAFAFVLRLFCFTGIIGSDDVQYAHFANLLAKGHYALELHHFAVRFGLLVPVAGSYTLFGISEASTVLVPLTASVLSVALVFCIARRLYGLDAAVIAALMFSTFPLAIRYASILVPEPIAEAYVLTAVFVYISAPERSEITAGAAAGVILGLAYLTREIAAFVVLAILIDAMVRRWWHLAAAVAVGSLCVVLIEGAAYGIVTGDPLFRLHALYAHSAHQRPFELLVNPMYRLLHLMPSLMLVPSQAYGLHSLVAVLLVAVSVLVSPLRRVRLCILWAAIPGLYLNFGTGSFRTFTLIPIVERYLEPLYPPLFILSGAMLARVAAKKHAKVAVLTMLVIVGAWGTVTAYSTRATGWRTVDIVRLRTIAREATRTDGRIVAYEGPRAWAWRDAMEVIAPGMATLDGRREFVIRPDSTGAPIAAPLVEGRSSK